MYDVDGKLFGGINSIYVYSLTYIKVKGVRVKGLRKIVG